MIFRLAAVGGAGVEDDLAVQGARLRVPVRRVRQVAHVPEVHEHDIDKQI